MSKEKTKLNERDAFILEKAKSFTPVEIEVLLKREGFTPVSHTRIYQLLEMHGVKPYQRRKK